MHATSPTTPYLSLFARRSSFLKEHLDAELYTKRRLCKIRYVRKTVYVLPKDMVPTAFAATRIMTVPVSQAYAKTFGVTEKQYAETAKQIMQLLKGNGGLTAKQIRNHLQTSLKISPVVNLMCDQGLLIRGAPEKGWKSNLHTYYLLDEYFPNLKLDAANEEEARKMVVRQYLASFAPATENDVSWWTGFTKSQVKRILAELKNEISYVDVAVADKALIMLSQETAALAAADSAGAPVVNLVPSLDPYLMGYKDRERYLDPARYSYVFDRGGNATATILVDGRVAGVWDFEKPFVKVFLFDRAEADILGEVHVQAKAVGAFISGMDVKVKECVSMVPLTERSAGSVMSPLKGS